MNTGSPQIVEKDIQPVLIAGMRMTAPYAECGQGFKKVCKQFGRFMAGAPLLLCYDRDYQEVANYEVCVPLKRSPGKEYADFSIRELEGGRCISLIHRGPYDQLSGPYESLKAYLAEHGEHAVMPTREVYLKGPGMFFKGNPKNYQTELQMFLG